MSRKPKPSFRFPKKPASRKRTVPEQKSHKATESLAPTETSQKTQGEPAFLNRRKKRRQSKGLRSEFSLSPLTGVAVYTGVKSLSNQLFLDVFDEQGHHDRVLDNEDSLLVSENFTELKNKYLLVKRNQKASTLQATPESSPGICFNFLESPDSRMSARHIGLAELTRPLGLQRHLYSKL